MASQKSYILGKDIHKIAVDWKKWKGTTLRPLPEHDVVYSKHFRQILRRPKARLLVLGATPELRTLGHQYNFQITCADRNLDMYLATSLLVRGKIAEEIFVKADWRNLPLAGDHYDLVAGDDVLNMLPWSEWDLMLQKISSLLKPKGCFSTHLIVKHKDAWQGQKLEDVFQNCAQGKIENPQDFLVQAAATMWNPQAYEFSWPKFLQKVKRLKERKKIKNDFGIYQTYKNFAGISVLPPQAKYEKIAQKYFKIVSVDYAQQFEYCAAEPVYLLQKLDKKSRQCYR